MHNKPHSAEAKIRMALKKLGKHHTKEHNEKIRLAHIGEKAYNWKGDNARYSAIHMWVNDHLPQIKICHKCYSRENIDLANITGEYTRDFSNWLYLCRS